MGAGCLYICLDTMSLQCPWRPEIKSIEGPGAEVANDCEPQSRYLGSNACPLEEQPMLITTGAPNFTSTDLPMMCVIPANIEQRVTLLRLLRVYCEGLNQRLQLLTSEQPSQTGCRSKVPYPCHGQQTVYGPVSEWRQKGVKRTLHFLLQNNSFQKVFLHL